MHSSESAVPEPSGPPPSIGATLEQVRLNHRVSRLSRALTRLQGIADEATAAGQAVPPPLAAAQRAFEEELAGARLTLATLSVTRRTADM